MSGASNRGSGLRTVKLKNAGGVQLRNYADGIYIDFPMNYSEQAKQIVWKLLKAEAERLDIELGQYLDE